MGTPLTKSIDTLRDALRDLGQALSEALHLPQVVDRLGRIARR